MEIICLVAIGFFIGSDKLMQFFKLLNVTKFIRSMQNIIQYLLAGLQKSLNNAYALEHTLNNSEVGHDIIN